MAGLKRAGAGLAALFFGAAFVLVGAAAATAADPPATPLTISKQGYFTSKITGALPPVLVKEIPPAPVCLVVPQACTQDVDALKVALSLNDGVPLPDIPDYLVPQPVPPGELPIGMIGGATRYTSTLQFQLPTIAPKSQVNRFDVVIPDGTIAFSIQSPAFRQAILTGLSQYPEQQPEVIQKFVDDVTQQNTALATFEPTGIEACMITSAWEAGESQDPATIPKKDCIVGGLGKHDAGAGTWTFDLSGVLQAWLDGKPNMGITLAPEGAQNVAYGDPDPSTNFILTLQSAAQARIDVGPPLEELPIDTGVGVADEAPLDAGGISDSGPSLVSGAGVSAPTQIGRGATRPKLIASKSSTPWWVWLIIPFVLGGAAALSIALDAVPDLATRRPGALTRLTADLDHRSAP